MSQQIIGHYIGQKEELLKEFNQIVSLMENFMVLRFGKLLAGTLATGVLQEYEKLIPKIPYIQGIRGKPFNAFLLITARELAVYKVMKKLGRIVEEAWELCNEAIRLKLTKMPIWKRWLLKYIMFSPIVMAIVKRRAGK